MGSRVTACLPKFLKPANTYAPLDNNDEHLVFTPAEEDRLTRLAMHLDQQKKKGRPAYERALRHYEEAARALNTYVEKGIEPPPSLRDRMTAAREACERVERNELMLERGRMTVEALLSGRQQLKTMAEVNSTLREIGQTKADLKDMRDLTREFARHQLETQQLMTRLDAVAVQLGGGGGGDDPLTADEVAEIRAVAAAPAPSPHATAAPALPKFPPVPRGVVLTAPIKEATH